ncbi:MAG: zinc ribbon domain-containing protein, partial [Myxococcales bacterium]|nr:zinc ribbon domain-containing protein [Myxococcales bacterium]
SATDTSIVFSETGNYEFTIDGSNCKASVSRSRSYKLVQRAGEEPAKSAEPPSPPPPPPPPAPTATAKPDPVPPYEGDCDPAKSPARFEVRPARKLLRPGESFTLAVVVTDKHGCRLALAPDLSAEANDTGKGLSFEKLTVKAASDAPAGTANVLATLGGKSVTVVVEVALPEQYDALLKARGLNQAGEDDTAAVAEIAVAFGGSQTEAEDTSKHRRITFLAVAGGVAALLAFAGLVLVRRGKRAHERDEQPRESAAPSNVTFFDAGSQAMECPKCGRVYPAREGFCADDGTPLVSSSSAPPAPAVAAVAPVAPASKRREPDKICPNCGDRFGPQDRFCGKDGTVLVPIN